MSKLIVEVDYNTAKTVLNGVRNKLTELDIWLRKLEEMLDKAALTANMDSSAKANEGTWP